MPKISRGRVFAIAAVAVAIVLLAWLAWPSPIPVDLATVSRAPMDVTVDEEARTRVRHVYTVSAPLAGTVLRSERDAGDPVTANVTVVAIMRPAAPSFHDPRQHQELQGASSAAGAAVGLADAERRSAVAALTYSRAQLGRIRELAGRGFVSRSALDKAVADAQANEAALASANAALEVRRDERRSAAARERNPADSVGMPSDSGCCVEVRAPVTGRVLKRIQESETVVSAGTPLIQIGDPQDLEIVAELLSTDAVQVRAGQLVHIDGWGGQPVEGRVKRVEPSGFLKVSALGIEEQRVRVIIDFTGPPRLWAAIGHDFRVVVQVVIWKGDNVLTVPLGALFRINEKWAVYREKGGRARAAEIVIGHRNDRGAEILSGLAPGDSVILHPSDRVRDGSRVAARAQR